MNGKEWTHKNGTFKGNFIKRGKCQSSQNEENVHKMQTSWGKEITMKIRNACAYNIFSNIKKTW